MKRTAPLSVTLSSALLASSLVFAASCKSGGTAGSHWNIDSVPSSMVQHFSGYRGPLDGTYREHQWRKKKDITLTLRRHFLNNNPENPFAPHDEAYYAKRRNHSILPNPLYYMHAESISTGLIALGWSGSFIPLPIDSLIGTLTPGGPSEFADGIWDTVTFDWEDEPEPPPVEDFEVKNR